MRAIEAFEGAAHAENARRRLPQAFVSPVDFEQEAGLA